MAGLLSNYNHLKGNLEELGVVSFSANLDFYLDCIAKGEKNVVDSLYEMTEKEKSLRSDRQKQYTVKTAGFPFFKTIDDFDFSYQPSINRKEIDDYCSLRFVENQENIVLVGSCGVRKTHLAIAIATIAAMNHYSTYFISMQDLIAQLKKAEDENRLDIRLKHFLKYKVLVIDEVGYLNMDEKSANLFFQLVSKRYEKKSTILTTNRSLDQW
ncbi:MAG: ATP-binding protein, partial [Bacillota bacterium]|nr:ATP-binding protein [Bacillota bacterium]